MKMKPENVLGKKIVVNRNNHNFFYTVKQILDINSVYILFLDRDDKQMYFRWKDIKEIYDETKQKKQKYEV